MNKYYDIDHDKIYTEDELRADYEERKANCEIDPVIYDTFEYYLNACMTENNGSLKRIASDIDIDNKRKWTALKISAQTDYEYNEVLNVLRKLNVHGNWTVDDIIHRPVNIDELVEIVEEEMERK